MQQPTQEKKHFKRRGFGGRRFDRARRPPRPPMQQRGPLTPSERKTAHIPDVAPGVLRIIPIGGVEQVGQNMTAIEYGNDIIIVDAGIQFADVDHPGVDYIIPNTRYLEERKEKIRGLFITHGHLDHIGAIPFLIEKIGNPPIYSRQFGAVMIMKRQEEFPHLPKLQMNIVDPEETIRAGEAFVVRSFAISHTIPDSMGLVITTPVGDIAFIEDVRVDNVDGVPTEEEIEQYKRFKDKDILLLTMDSTSIEKRGFSLSEQVIVKNVVEIIRNVPGRIIIASFASQVERMVAIIEAAERFGKKVVIEGRSMKTNVEISKKLGLIKTTNIIPLEEMEQYPPNKILVLATGSQGEEFAALVRMANKTHKQIRLQPTDTILLSSSVVPGNDRDVDRLKDNLYRSGAKIITYRDSDVHASGHGNREELAWIHDKINYRFFMPVHGNHYMLCQHAELSQSLGTPKENIVVPDNGSIIEISENGQKLSVRKEKAPSDLVMVDGFSVSDVQNVVIRDRQMLAQDGMFIVMAVVDSKTGILRKSPDLISRGFVYLKENQELLRHARVLIRRTIEQTSRNQNPIDFDYVKNAVTDAVSKYLFQKTAKRPLVIPVVLAI
ncbi:MAG TPA: ribonuclease J [Candidatus Paceibacterota bacterium]|nr:ribonuclease J [Candidatus Paceibacterota bacterium]